jgi:hypothetical protein
VIQPVPTALTCSPALIPTKPLNARFANAERWRVAVSVPLPEQKSIRFQPLGPQHTFDRHVRMGRNKPIGLPARDPSSGVSRN